MIPGGYSVSTRRLSRIFFNRKQTCDFYAGLYPVHHQGGVSGGEGVQFGFKFSIATFWATVNQRPPTHQSTIHWMPPVIAQSWMNLNSS